MRRMMAGIAIVLWASSVCILAAGEAAKEPDELAAAKARAAQLVKAAAAAEKAAQELKVQAETAAVKARAARGEATRARMQVQTLALRSGQAGKSEEAKVVYAIETLLGDSNERVRMMGIQILNTKYGRYRYHGGGVSRRQASLPAPVSDLLLKAVQEDESEEVRRNAAYALSQAASPAATDAMLAALADSSSVVRDAARSYFVRVYGKNLPADAEAWRKEIEAHKAEQEKLLARLKSGAEADYGLLSEIEQRFLRFGDTRVIEPLLAIVNREGTAQHVASRAMQVAGSLMDEESLATVLAILRNAKVPAPVRAEAASALGSIGTPSCLAALLQTLEDKQAPALIRANAARALSGFSGELVGPALMAALTDENPQVRSYAGQGLRSLQGDAVNELLLEALQHENASVRTEAARVVGQRRMEGGIDALIALIGDGDEEVQEAAVMALGMRRDEKTTAPLLSIYKDASPRLKARIISSVGWNESEEVAAIVREAVSHEDEQVRLAAIYSVSQTKPATAFDLLSKAAKEDQSESVKRAAVSGLASFREPRATTLLLELAQNTEASSDLRSTALTALSGRAEEVDVDVLLKLAQDNDSRVRRSAIGLLGRGRHMSAVPALIELLKDKDASAKTSAYLALRSITGQRFRDSEVEKWEAWWKQQQGKKEGEKK